MPKNILFLMTDQHRLDCTGFDGPGKVATPNIDRIADSVAFTNCTTVNPICTPARTALLTGRYTHQIGTLAMSGDLSPQIPTYAHALREAGYWTAGVGKFHFMQGWPWSAEQGTGHDLVALKEEIGAAYGFDHVWETAGKQLALKNYCEHMAHLDRKGLLQAYRDFVESSRNKGRHEEPIDDDRIAPWPFDEADYVDVLTGDEIVRAIRERPTDKPFLVFGSFCGPHPPFDPPQRYLDMIEYEEADDFILGDRTLSAETKNHLWRKRRAYKAMIRLIDDQVGRLFDTLEAEGVLDDTVILFTTDHGEMMGDHFRLHKSIYYRQASTVPTAIRHPDHLDGRTCASPVEITDLTATMLDIAGLDPAEALGRAFPQFTSIVPCRSLMPIVRGEAEAVRDYAFSECSNNWQMIKTERWKYVRVLDADNPDAPHELFFDLESDPDELDNRIDDPALQASIAWCRHRRDFVLDTTPPCQTRWAPRMGGQ